MTLEDHYDEVKSTMTLQDHYDKIKPTMTLQESNFEIPIAIGFLINITKMQRNQIILMYMMRKVLR